MSTDSNRMAHNCNNTTSNNTFVSQSHEQFIPKRMKKANLFVKSLGVLALILASSLSVFGQCVFPTITAGSTTLSQGSTSQFTANLGNSLFFDGTNDYVALANNSPMNNFNHFGAFVIDQGKQLGPEVGIAFGRHVVARTCRQGRQAWVFAIVLGVGV